MLGPQNLFTKNTVVMAQFSARDRVTRTHLVEGAAQLCLFVVGQIVHTYVIYKYFCIVA